MACIKQCKGGTMGESQRTHEEKNLERIKASEVRVTPHAQGLLITINYCEERFLQVVFSRDQALKLSRAILNVLYSMGLKPDH